jgi:uncharacterized HAD superfamily protein
MFDHRGRTSSAGRETDACGRRAVGTAIAIAGHERVMTPLRIGVDVDDVLVESLPGYVEAFRRYFHRDVKIEDAAWEIFDRYPDISATQALTFFAELEAADFLGTRPAHPEAVQAMRTLARIGHQLTVVTGRLMMHRNQTRRLLTRAGIADLFEELVHRDGETAVIYKPRVVRERCLDLLIEDERHVAVATAAVSVPVLLFDRPWNQGELPRGVIRVGTWDEALRGVEGVAEARLRRRDLNRK